MPGEVFGQGEASYPRLFPPHDPSPGCAGPRQDAIPPPGETWRPLAAHIQMAAFGRDLVILDTRTAQYELLVGAADAATLTADRRAIASDDPELIAAIASEGWLGDGGTRPPPRAAAPPRREALACPPSSVRLRDLAWMAKGSALMVRHYYGRSFPYLLRHARRPCRGGDQPDEVSAEERVLARAAVFHQLGVWTPFAGDCLFRCFMLLRLLGSDASKVDWVFGVRTWPFLAHCWLQRGDWVLTDAPEQVSLFAPILVA